MATERPVRAYTYRESSNCFLPRDVLDALGERSHISQGRVIAFATSKVAAWLDLAELGLVSPDEDPHRGARTLKVAEDVHAGALIAAALDGDRSVYVLPLSGREVAAVWQETDVMDKHPVRRYVKHVGRILFVPNVGWQYAADDTPESGEPVVTDAMIHAAYDAVSDYFREEGEWHPVPEHGVLRVAIGAALQAQVRAKKNPQ